MAELKSRALGPRQCAQALAFLSRDARANLYLIDLVARAGEPGTGGEPRPELMGVWRGDALAGVAALRPSVVFDADAGAEVVAALMPTLERVGAGLVKSPAPVVEAFWERLSHRRRRRALLDRVETAYALRRERFSAPEPTAGVTSRPARASDLDDLVVAARESLREEQRPDPFVGDPTAFRRWVAGRVSRARVVEAEVRVVFAGYADVRLPQGWLVQGVYTWPDARRRGVATAGVAELCREAFAAGADHVQLTVVEGNEAGHRLYRGLGFEPFAQLRTILFT